VAQPKVHGLRLVTQEVRPLLLSAAGVVLLAASYTLFQVPHHIAAGGISGLSLVVNYFTGLPVGMTYLALNIPMFVQGFIYLGRWRFLVRTLLVVTAFSFLTDFMLAWWPRMLHPYPVTENVLLCAIFGGIVSGLGSGLVYRAGASNGGTGILGRVINVKTGVPLSQVYVMTDGIVVILMGVVFGWETSLFALLMLFLWGMASDYVLEGPSSVRVVTVVTERPDLVTAAVRARPGGTVSRWEITGGYSGEARSMLMATIYRSQVNDPKDAILTADPDAFVVVGSGQQAINGSFRRGKRGD
jgi:uncharacterized membrane-anchored protein YitT (DUF2179 family)